jgi:UDP-3-O-[3-hydroxymyristoyl] glucosamine N-acyltransferase
MRADREGPDAKNTLSVGEVAERIGGTVQGDPSVRIAGIAPLNQASKVELGLLAQKRYLKDLPEAKAGALLVSSELEETAADYPSSIVVPDPHAALPVILALFYPTPRPEPGIHPTAVLGKGVVLGSGLSVGPYAVVEEGAVVGDGTRIGPHAVVGAGCELGKDVVLHPHVVLYPGTRLGDGVIIHAGTCLGVDGFGYAPSESGIQKIPQVGSCILGNDVEIGANCAIDRGSIGQTVIGNSTKLDNLVHMGHNVRVGQGCLLTGQLGVAGSAQIGNGVMSGGQAGIAGHITIGDGARIAGQAGVIGDLPAGATVTGFPARERREYLRAVGMLYKLPDTVKTMRGLEKRMEALEARGES